MSKSKTSSSKVLKPECPSTLKAFVFPIFLMISTINVTLVLPYIVTHRNGDISGVIRKEGPLQVILEAWSSVDWKLWQYPLFLTFLLIWGAVSIVLLPGDIYHGPFTASGFRPRYRRTGFKFYLLSMAYFIPLIWYFPVIRIYYEFVTLIGYLIVFGLIASLLVLIKGHLWPSPGVFGSSSSLAFDFYWGLELYPRLGAELDLKTLINSRFGLFLWQLIVLVCGKVNYELYQSSYNRGEIHWPILCNILLQTVYLAKFYYWEDGYMDTIDIAYDRFGYYLCFGCMAWVPAFYTLSSLYLVRNSPSKSEYGPVAFVCNTTFGLAMIGLNYWSDLQKKQARESGGKCQIWGKPAKVIHAVYLDEDLRPQKRILLVSGFWALARHVNYFFEIAAALSWSLPALNQSVIPYLYVIFLTVLLFHRTKRDQEKCSHKYGGYWDQYCKIVPYRVIPFIY